MRMYEEEVNAKDTKIFKILKFCIIILIIFILITVAGMIYIYKSITIVNVDNIKNDQIEELLYIESTEAGKEVYIPIIKMAECLGYKGYTGDYKEVSEDKNKCHIICENEIAMFSLDSNILTKIGENSEREYITLDKSVFEKNGELYTTKDGIQKALNVVFFHDNAFKNINIYKMDFLLNHYATSLGKDNYSIDFNDKKAILEYMMIIKENNKYGVINVTQKDEYILETKYDEIKYLPEINCFKVKNNGKYGIMTKDANLKVKMIYDEIETMDNKHGLYLVKQNNAYGVINDSGEVIIDIEYREIGTNISEYLQNSVENKFVLLNEIIPVKDNNDLWALFNIRGEKLTDFKYQELGCMLSSAINSYPVLIIPQEKIIVVKQNEYYNLVDLNGKQLIKENTLNSVYMKIDTDINNKQFFMTYNNNQNVINIQEWLAGNNEEKTNK